jgi:hypothetical protein
MRATLMRGKYRTAFAPEKVSVVRLEEEMALSPALVGSRNISSTKCFRTDKLNRTGKAMERIRFPARRSKLVRST